MKKIEFSISEIVLLLSLWAFFYCLHSIIYVGVIDVHIGWSQTLISPDRPIFWAILSGFLFIAGLIIHFYYQKYSESPVRPLVNTREIVVIFIAIDIVAALSLWSSMADIVDSNEDVASTVATIRDCLEMVLLFCVYAAFHFEQFVEQIKTVQSTSKKEQLKELLDSGILTKEEYEKEINSL